MFAFSREAKSLGREVNPMHSHPKEALRRECPELSQTASKPEPLKPEPPTRRRKPLPGLDDWEFWRFLMAALSLVWDVVKTFLR